MKPSQQELAAAYRDLSDDDLAALSADIVSLTDEARSALQAEIARRGISADRLGKMHSFELRREEIFDLRESRRRQNMATDGMSGRDWLWTAGALVVFFAVVLIYEWARRFHR